MSSEQDSWIPLTAEQKRNLALMEIIVFCKSNRECLTNGSIPFYLLLKRCGYVASLLKEVGFSECGELCQKASEAEKPSLFLKLCGESSDKWNEITKTENEKESRRVGVV